MSDRAAPTPPGTATVGPADASLIRRRRIRVWAAFVCLWLVIGGLVVWQAGRIARDEVLADLGQAGRVSLSLNAETLGAEIDKQRALPVVLARDPDALAVLRAPEDTGARDRLNRKLEALTRATRAAVIYLIDDHGLTLAASNWATPVSFVGNDYGFRPYYAVAMAEGAAEHFAMGTVSHRPGMYLARRIDDDRGAVPRHGLGVMVVKIEFDRLEAIWAGAPERIFATDARGVVLVSGVAGWRFRSLTPLPEEMRAAIRAGLQYGDAPLDPLPFAPAAGDQALLRVDDAVLLHQSLTMPEIGWTLHLMTPADQAMLRAVADARALAGTGIALLAALAAAGLYRRQQLQGRAARAALERQRLEAAVADRTADLARAYAALEAGMEERRQAEAAARRLQDDLIQAGRLAVLGRIAASVAHEINQPVAAIRAFADNARAFLERDRADAALANLSRIGELTTRIGTITGQLRGFARKAGTAPRPVQVTEAIDGALLLLGHRIRAAGIDLVCDIPSETGATRVVAERVRLEQVLVNLIGNAIDAVEGRPTPRIAIRVARIIAGDGTTRLRILVSDNGPGLPPDIREALFLPFRTTKPDGLGLGLVISADLVRDMGGTLAAEPPATTGGATFIIDLPEAG
ncbi:ATP-binding protein [Tistrella mobilis]|uniref:ATP-binding protein n=1 Tax=Tistrella mobilis TaxID=171437 RepID=UPI0031F669E9